MTTASIQPPPQVRHIGRVNWEGLRTLYLKEVRRFAKVATQTVLAPLVTTLLFLAIFVLALGRSVDQMGGVSFMEFLAPGLIMMTMVQNAFANTSSSILIAKVQGNIVDVLMPPLSPGELTAGFALGGMTRGLLVGLTTWGAMSVVVERPSTRRSSCCSSRRRFASLLRCWACSAPSGRRSSITWRR
jgi:ABC-2 type transport system permease protein